MSKNRIKTIDGLRTIAVLGVIYAHNWGFAFSNPPLKIGINWAKILSVLGTGVDLFFVISGFCMYQMYATKEKNLNWQNYFDFIVRRWMRIAPAFYVCIFVTFGLFWYSTQQLLWKEILYTVTFMNNFFFEKGIGFHFWSLGTEWCFYLSLPLLLLCTHRLGFGITITLLMSLSLLARFFVAYYDIEVATSMIFTRFNEFAWGIIVAYLYQNKVNIPILSNLKGLFIGITVLCIGRFLMSTESKNIFGTYVYLCETIDVVILSLGYAIIIWNVLHSETLFSKFLALPFMQYLGKVSYSMYLWHWLVINYVAVWMIPLVGTTYIASIFTFMIVSLCTVVISHYSYIYFEAFYFNSRK
jgi:peptidoglycan/LPS O-acetylase OafA/YrhL